MDVYKKYPGEMSFNIHSLRFDFRPIKRVICASKRLYTNKKKRRFLHVHIFRRKWGKTVSTSVDCVFQIIFSQVSLMLPQYQASSFDASKSFSDDDVSLLVCFKLVFALTNDY